MYSPEALDDTPSADLTGRARIRDAALGLFGERGVARTSLREIARSAGLSAGLVRHHFGSKDGLRAACDAYALERLMAVKEAGVAGSRLANPGFLSDVQPELLKLHRYLARSIVDGSPAAGAVLDRMIVLSEQWIAAYHADEVSDERAVACVLAAAQIGLLMVREQISTALGVDVSSPQGHLRLAHALVDFYSIPLLSPDLAAEAHAALAQLQPKPPRRPQGASRRKGALAMRHVDTTVDAEPGTVAAASGQAPEQHPRRSSEANGARRT